MQGRFQILCPLCRGRGTWKRGCSKGGCMNFIVQISSKCEKGEGIKKSKIVLDILYGSLLTSNVGLPLTDVMIGLRLLVPWFYLGIS